MCGITGIVKNSKISSKEENSFKFSLKNLLHRGPDSKGIIRIRNGLIGVRRLSIIDVVGGGQPLFNEDKSIQVVYNGEIYNYKKIVKKLKKNGHKLKTQSDGEVIAHLYEEYGISFLKYLRGMFAIFLIDKKSKEVFLIRDRIGEKPLFYYKDGEKVIFSSEIKSLLCFLSKKDKVIDFDSLNSYFHYQFVPEPNTILKNVKKVPFASYIKYNYSKNLFKIKKYWSYSRQNKDFKRKPEVRLKNELKKIARIVDRSDVPVGISLSGGIDSSVVASMLVNYSNERRSLKAFTVGYVGEPSYDERKYARKVARYLKLELNEIELGLSDLANEFVDYVRASDEPIADISGFSLYKIMEEARKKGIRVMMSGLGGDELFWGYPWIKKAVEKSYLKDKLIRKKDFVRRFFYKKDYQIFKKQDPDMLIFYDIQPDFEFFNKLKGRFFTKNAILNMKDGGEYDPFVKKDWGNISETIMKLKMDTWLVSNSIGLSDKLSMANSIELRLPLVDYKLVNFAFEQNKSCPDLYKKEGKIVLKKVAKDILPYDIVYRKKEPFRPPTGQWIKKVISKYGSLLKNGYLVSNNIVSKDFLKDLLKEPVKGLNLILIYKTIYLEIWLRLFVEKSSLKNL